MTYKAKPIPTDAVLNRELQRIDEAFRNVHYFEPQIREPSPLKVGLVAYADGTNWDPGTSGTHAGEGLYVYTSGGWVKLNDYGTT